MAAAYLPHGGPFRAVDIGLDHFPHAGIQSPLDGGFCIGQQLLWFHAFAVRFRRFAGLGGDPPERLPLERWLVVGGLAAFVGVAVFASVLVDWWSSGRAALFAVRRCSLGLVLLLSGALSVMNALMTSMLELHFEAREER